MVYVTMKEDGPLTHRSFEKLSLLLAGVPVKDVLCSLVAAKASFMSWSPIMDDNIFTHFFSVFSNSTCRSQAQGTVKRVTCLTGKLKWILLPLNLMNVCGQLRENRELE